MDDLTSQGIQSLKEGEKARARSLFLSALEIDGDNAQAWLWLSGAVESDPDRLDCLEQVLRIDPNNQAAAKGVALLVGKGVVPAEFRGPPGEEADLQPQEKELGPGWQHEMPEETPAAPTASMPEMAPESQNISAPPETPEEAVIPAALTETPAAMETTPAPATKGEGQEEDAFKLPESFFQTTEAAEETFPGWMATLTPEDAVLPPAAQSPDASPGQALNASAETQASPMAAPILALEAQAPDGTTLQRMGTPAPAAPAARLEEKTLFKIRPSLVTSIVVYGLGAIILFMAAMGLLLVIYKPESVASSIGLVLMVCLLIAMLAVLIWKSISHLMTSYTFTNRRLYLEEGVFRRSHKSIPLPKIKSVTLKQGPLQKIIGIGNLTVHAEALDGQEELTRLIDVSKAAQVIKRIDGAQHLES